MLKGAKNLNNSKSELYGHNKRIFFFFAWISFVIFALFFISFFVLINPDAFMLKSFYWVILSLVILSISIVFYGIFILSISLLLRKNLLYPRFIFVFFIKIFPNIIASFWQFFGISKEKIQESFINVMNSLFLYRLKDKKPSNVLLLLPHCLQNHECPRKITWSIDNCVSCGKCSVGDLKKISQELDIDIFVATGGTVARRVVKDTRPDCILAVACPRDLSSGMIDTYPVPVYGILNERPFGPCFDTTISVQNVREILTLITKTS